MFRPLLCVFLFSLSAVTSLNAEPSYINFPADIDWVSRKSSHFHIVYRRGQQEFAERTLRAAERAYGLIRPIFPDAPDRTWIVLADFQDSLNGYSLNLPYPHMVLFASPPDPTGQLASLDHWLDSLVLHEYVHTLHLYPARGLWSTARAIFGSWVLPVGLMPSHMHEGLATFLETELTRGGRGRGSIFHMLQRIAVLEGKWGEAFAPADLRDGSTSRWPHGTAPYFFGYYLYQDLWRRKGASGVRLLTEDIAGSWPYLYGSSFEDTYAEDLGGIWKKIYDTTRQESAKEIERIRKGELSHLTYLTDTKYGKSDLAVIDDKNQLAYRASDPDEGSRIELIDLPSRKISRSYPVDSDSRAGLCSFKSGSKNWLVFLETMGGRGYRTSRLTSLDLQSERRYSMRSGDKTVDHILVTGCPTDSGDRVTFYREHAGEGTLERWTWKNPAKPSQRLATWKVPTGNWISAVAESERDTLFVLRNGTRSLFYRWSPPRSPVAEHSVDALVYAMRPSGDRRVSLIANTDGRDEVWDWDLSTRSARKRVAVLGGVSGFASDGERQWVTSYRHGGYDLAEASRVRSPTRTLTGPVALEPSPSAPVAIEPERSYQPWPTLLPKAWIPSVLVVPNGFQAGAMIPGFDVAQRHYYTVFGGYDSRGSIFTDLNYQYRFSRALGADGQAFYFPSYIISRQEFLKRWGATIGLTGTTDFARALGAGSWAVRLAAVFRRLESYQGSGANQSVGFGIELSRSWNFRSRPLSIAPESGTAFGVQHERFFQALGSTHNYSSTTASLTQYLAAPWHRRHVFYASGRLGFTEGTTLINNFFQGGGELIFSQGPGFFLNRGFLPGTFLGRRMLNLSLEYRFPVAQIDRGYQYFPAFLKRIHGAIVSDTTTVAVSAKDKDLLKQFYTSVGVELKSDWTLGYYLPATARVGVYRGFGEYGEPLYVTFAVEASL